MKSKIITLVLVTATVCFISCQKKSAKKYDKIEKMNWLLGSWEQKIPEGLLTETWKKDNDSTFSGETYFINPKDTVHFESIQLVQKEEELTYIATVPGQNNDEPVEFKMTSDANNSFIFANPAHDYPQKIVYNKINATSLLSIISGKQQGKSTQESYAMTKKQ